MSHEQAVGGQLLKRIAEERQRAAESLMAGRCSDFSAYRYAVGYIKCLDDMEVIAKEIIEDLLKG